MILIAYNLILFDTLHLHTFSSDVISYICRYSLSTLPIMTGCTQVSLRSFLTHGFYNRIETLHRLPTKSRSNDEQSCCGFHAGQCMLVSTYAPELP
jgi:hypothetical protein